MRCSSYLSALTIVTLFSGSFQSFFGFEFHVLDARTDRGSFSYGGPTNGGESHISENIVTD
jgi:hypothetical protein